MVFHTMKKYRAHTACNYVDKSQTILSQIPFIESSKLGIPIDVRSQDSGNPWWSIVIARSTDGFRSANNVLLIDLGSSLYKNTFSYILMIEHCLYI